MELPLLDVQPDFSIIHVRRLTYSSELSIQNTRNFFNFPEVRFVKLCFLQYYN